MLIGATELSKILPMMTTAAGTFPPASALISGPALPVSKRSRPPGGLGAVVSGYDVRAR